jgi:CheY-like chemotaxis protein
VGPSRLRSILVMQPRLDYAIRLGNGYKVAEQLRHVHRHQSLTLVALSGLGQEEDKRHATEAGFDVHFTKPVDIPALNKLLASIVVERPGRPVEPEE